MKSCLKSREIKNEEPITQESFQEINAYLLKSFGYAKLIEPNKLLIYAFENMLECIEKNSIKIIKSYEIYNGPNNLLNLDPNSIEYKRISDIFSLTSGGAKPAQIHKILNKDLKAKFITEVKDFQVKYQANTTKSLYNFTNVLSLDTIRDLGYDICHNGNNPYLFFTNVNGAIQLAQQNGARYIIFADVLLGNIKNEVNVRGLSSAHMKANKNVDSFFNGNNEYAIPRTEQILPTYVIYF